MVIEYLLYKLYVVYDEYVKTNYHQKFLEDLMSILTTETQSEFGIITKEDFSKNDLLKNKSIIKIDSLLYMVDQKQNISIQITSSKNTKKNLLKTATYSFPLPLLEDSEKKSYVCILRNTPPIRSIQVFRIYLNREKTRSYICVLGNRKGGYTNSLKRQLPLVMRTLSLLLSKHKAMEELQANIKDLKESKAQIERFAYLCSHDLKEPLRTIYSFLQLIKNETENLHTPQVFQYYDFIFKGVYRMRSLIENLLIHSELGPRNLQLETFKLSEIVDTVVQNNTHYIIENKAKIKIDKDIFLTADKFLITQLIHNLVSNAFKYSKEEASSVHIGASIQDTGWEIYVKDNGIGIPESYHKNIFDQFMRINKNEEYKNNGIGLAICKSIIEKHKGKIWLTSKEGKGTTFYFKIPRDIKTKTPPLNIKKSNLIQHHQMHKPN